MPLDVSNMMHSAMVRFIQAVDTVMEADDLTARERRDLIGHWAYRYKQPDMPEQLKRAIARCQGDPDDPSLVITATCRIDQVTGEEVAFNPGDRDDAPRRSWPPRR